MSGCTLPFYRCINVPCMVFFIRASTEFGSLLKIIYIQILNSFFFIITMIQRSFRFLMYFRIMKQSTAFNQSFQNIQIDIFIFSFTLYKYCRITILLPHNINFRLTSLSGIISPPTSKRYKFYRHVEFLF